MASARNFSRVYEAMVKTRQLAGAVGDRAGNVVTNQSRAWDGGVACVEQEKDVSREENTDAPWNIRRNHE